MSSEAIQPRPGRMSGGAWLMAAVLAGEVAGYVLFKGDAARGLLVTAVLVGGLLAGAARRGVWRMARLDPTHAAMLIAMTAVGLLAIALAWRGGNDPYYLAADAYHWFIEGLLMAVVTAAVLARGSGRDAARAAAVIGLIVGVACLVVFITGTLGVTKEGTHFVRNLGIARLIVGRGTPQMILLVVVAAAWRMRRWDRVTRLLLLAALPMLLAALAVTLKRTLWLSFPLAAAIAVLPRRWLGGGAVMGVWLLIAAGAGAALMPEAAEELLHRAADSLTYNPGFTVEETLARRGEQLGSVWPYVTAHPWGHGFGASVYAYWTRGQTYAQVHYIHNLYAYYALQLGVFPLLFLLLGAGWFIWRLVRQEDAADDWGFASRAGAAGMAAMLLNGVSLVSTHSCFAGFVIGLGMIGSTRLGAAGKERGG